MNRYYDNDLLSQLADMRRRLDALERRGTPQTTAERLDAAQGQGASNLPLQIPALYIEIDGDIYQLVGHYLDGRPCLFLSFVRGEGADRD